PRLPRPHTYTAGPAQLPQPHTYGTGPAPGSNDLIHARQGPGPRLPQPHAYTTGPAP
ncbi:predicted protein, partial [Nematostella vectensis]